MPARRRSAAEPLNPSIRVHTLGRFRVEVNGAPLRFGRKAQRRPLDLLKLLIAHGGEGVAKEQVAEDLWPDAEGDAALAALRTTLGRLRRLLGATAVSGAGGALTLNPEVCWVDALALEQRLLHGKQEGREDSSSEADSGTGDAQSLYQGDFLPGECGMPTVLAARARLRAMLLRQLAELGRSHELAGRLDLAVSVYQRGLEIDAASEEIARRLMQCCRRCGRCAEGIAAYRSCQDALKVRLGSEPSAATRTVYDDLVREAARQAQPPARADALPVSGGRHGEISIAILPFEDLSPRGDRRRLATAIRETVVSLLDAVPQLSLRRGRKAVVDSANAPGATARTGEFAARYFLRGSVIVTGARLRASVQLLDARTGRYTWAEQLDHRLGDEIEAQEQIAIKVAEGLVAKLLLGQYPLILLRPDVQLWKALTMVFAHLNRQGAQDYRQARVLLDRVMEQNRDDPGVALASSSFDVSAAWRHLTPDPARLLQAAEQKLRQLHARFGYGFQGMPNLTWACALRGDLDEALLQGRRIVDRLPEMVTSHAFLGLPYQYYGRHAEALGKMDDALNVCPQPPHWLYKDRAVSQFCLGQYDEAIRGLATVLLDDYPRHRDANLLNARMMYVASLAAGGRIEQARHEATVTRAEHPGVSVRGWCAWHFKPIRIDSPARRIEHLLVASGLPA